MDKFALHFDKNGNKLATQAHNRNFHWRYCKGLKKIQEKH